MGRKIPSDEYQVEFLRSSGPGGQNVNKVETAVRLRFDVRASSVLADAEKDRLIRLAGRRATAEGEIILLARRFRTREKNREDAIARLHALVDKALKPPKRRRPTGPSRAALARRRKAKRRLSEKKRTRTSQPDDES